jgi:endonuclease YncB( thermonuclease family)
MNLFPLKCKPQGALLLGVFMLLIYPSVLIAWEGKVVRIVDGDTIDVLKDGKQVKIRLVAIDCPEKDQPWGKGAKQFISLLVLNKTVAVQPVDEDRYGLIVAWVFFEEINLSKALLRAGLAWHYRPYSDDSLLTALEAEAREAKKGLWSDSFPVPPWVWRKWKKTGKTQIEFSGGGYDS